jgi:hypothetical protein
MLEINLIGNALDAMNGAGNSGMRVHATSDEGRNVASRSPRVLVIDDEKLVAGSLSAVLKRFNYDSPVYSGETAIEAARQLCPDLVLSDVMMPKLNGVETVLTTCEICPQARILLESKRTRRVPSTQQKNILQGPMFTGRGECPVKGLGSHSALKGERLCRHRDLECARREVWDVVVWRCSSVAATPPKIVPSLSIRLAALACFL